MTMDLNGMKRPRSYSFSSLRECIESLEHSQEEGYVLYKGATPVLKVKSPMYVKMHSNGWTINRILRLIASGEHVDYRSDIFDPYVAQIDSYLQRTSQIYEKFKNIASDKKFAENIKHFAFAWIAFRARKTNESFASAYRGSDPRRKIKFLKKYVITPKMILFVGISGSGKSTAAATEYDGFVEINRDRVRRALFPVYKFTKDNEERVTRECYEIWSRAKDERKNVVVSDCNLKREYHDLWRKRALANGYEFELRYFPISIEDAWKNDLKRGGGAVVGREVIARQYRKWLAITDGPKYRADETKQKAIVCDIDGTLAKPTNRSFYDVSSKVLRDEPRKVIIEMLEAWAKTRDYVVLFVSGRPDSCIVDTTRWINDHVSVVNGGVYMRKTGDARKDRIVKEEIFWNDIAPKYHVVAVIDDRPQVVRMWHDIGLQVINVQEGYCEF